MHISDTARNKLLDIMNEAIDRLPGRGFAKFHQQLAEIEAARELLNLGFHDVQERATSRGKKLSIMSLHRVYSGLDTHDGKPSASIKEKVAATRIALAKVVDACEVKKEAAKPPATKPQQLEISARAGGFGTLMTSMRQARRMTQEGVANELGVAPATVRSWECGFTIPSHAMIEAISAQFNVPASALLAEKPPRNRRGRTRSPKVDHVQIVESSPPANPSGSGSAHANPLASSTTPESAAERSLLFLRSMRLAADERAYLLGEVWSNADQPAFMPGDDLFLSTAAAMLLSHRGEARVVVYDREGRERGVLWAPASATLKQHAHPTTQPCNPDISPAIDPRSAEEIRAAYIAFAVEEAGRP